MAERSGVRVKAKGSKERGRAWLIVTVDDREVRRIYLNTSSGEILDDVWMNADGRVESYSAPVGGTTAQAGELRAGAAPKGTAPRKTGAARVRSRARSRHRPVRATT